MGDPIYTSGLEEGIFKPNAEGGRWEICQAKLLRPSVVNVTCTFGVFLPEGVFQTPECVTCAQEFPEVPKAKYPGALICFRDGNL